MTTVSTLGSISTSTSTSTGTTSGSSSLLSGTMSQSDFLTLLTEQLKDQDPTNPVDNSQFVSQMAQFSTLSATQQLDTDLQSLNSSLTSSLQTSQVLNSSGLLDKQVLVSSSSVSYDGSGDSVTGAVNLTSAGDATVTITDASGNVVRTIDLGEQDAGLAQFTWDGKDSSGNAVDAGTYTLSASSDSTSLDTYVAGTVTGVGYGGSSVGTYLQVEGIGGVSLSSVAQIL